MLVRIKHQDKITTSYVADKYYISQDIATFEIKDKKIGYIECKTDLIKGNQYVDNPVNLLPECETLAYYVNKVGFCVDFPFINGNAVYYFKDVNTDEVLYIGKSKDKCLASRIRKHKNDLTFNEYDVDVFVYITQKEVDSLILEQYMIALFQPKFNKLRPTEASSINIKIPVFYKFVNINHGKVTNHV